MKLRLCLVGAASTLALSATAQTEKGTRTLGLSINNFAWIPAQPEGYGLAQQHQAFRLGLLTTGGVFAADNLLLSARLTTDYVRQRTQFAPGATDVRTNLTYGLGASVRYYVPGSGRGRFFGQVSADYLLTRRHVRYTTPNGPSSFAYTTTDVPVALDLGFNYFLTPTTALEATVGYQARGLGSSRPTSGAQASLGVRLFFRRPAAPQPQ